MTTPQQMPPAEPDASADATATPPAEANPGDLTVTLVGGSIAIPGLDGYSRLQLVAHGSSAVVYRATQNRLKRQVAIKVLLIDDVMTTLDNVEFELETLVQLSQQPHIVSIIDTGITDAGQPYIVMEYCEGGSYAQILKEHGPLPVAEVLDVGIKVGEALHAAHEVGIIHRDVKPANILRSRFGPALTDFGIAYADSLSTTTTFLKLTPHHASPETLLQQHQTRKSDLYSLASTMWNLLAGQPPYAGPGQNSAEFRQRVLSQPVPRVPRADVPEWLQVELARGMAKRPAHRHHSALEFVETLRLRMAQPTAGAPWAPPVLPADESVTLYVPASAPPAPVYVSPESMPESIPDSMPPLSAPPAPLSAPPAAFSAPPVPLSPGFPPGSPAGYSPVTVPGYSPGVEQAANGAHGGVGVLTPLRPTVTEDESTDDDSAPRWRRLMLAAVILGVILGLLTVIGVLLLRDQKTEPSQPAKPDSTPTQSARFVNEGAPRNFTLEDKGSSVTLRWEDASSGRAPVILVGAQADQELRAMANVEAGETSYTIKDLKSNVNYCFQAVSVLGNNTYGRSEPICTKR